MNRLAKPTQEICQTGIAGLDEIICGGLPKNRLYLVQGEPGTGKTTLALQFLLEGAREGETCLYITFSETRREILQVAESHGWDISPLRLFELSALEEQLKPETQNTVFHPSEVELNRTIAVVKSFIEQVEPTRIVFDSVSEMRTLAETSLRYRRQMLALKSYFAEEDITVLLLDDLTASKDDLHVQSIVHGVFTMEKQQPEFGSERRRFSVAKLRGVNFVGGKHDYVIRPGGVEIFPRLISSSFEPVNGSNLRNKPASSGINELDQLLDGGLDYGTGTLFLGPAGGGKSSIACQFAVAAANRGEKVAIYLFEESVATYCKRARAIGLNLEEHLKSGAIEIRKFSPAEQLPGEFSHMIKTAVVRDGTSVILIDSLNGYMHAMPQQEFLMLQLHELLSYLNNQGVMTLMILAQTGMMGTMSSPLDLTYLADTLVITRFFEARGAVKKAISVVKKRTGMHEDTIRQLVISGNGIEVGPALSQFQGVLTGVPRLMDPLLKSRPKPTNTVRRTAQAKGRKVSERKSGKRA